MWIFQYRIWHITLRFDLRLMLQPYLLPTTINQSLFLSPFSPSLSLTLSIFPSLPPHWPPSHVPTPRWFTISVQTAFFVTTSSTSLTSSDRRSMCPSQFHLTCSLLQKAFLILASLSGPVPHCSEPHQKGPLLWNTCQTGLKQLLWNAINSNLIPDSTLCKRCDVGQII